MENKNIQIVKECIEQIINAKQFDRIYDYYSEDCVFHNPPYVGLGFFPDDSSGEQLVVKGVASNGPSAGLVLEGDVLLRASDEDGIREGYDQLRTLFWGHGKPGSEVTLTLFRAGETVEVTIVRGRVEGFDNTLPKLYDVWEHFLLEEMPDFKTEIHQIIASGDLVAYYAINTGTSTIYHQSAVWPECSFLRLDNGKIVESWFVEDELTHLRQMGFQFSEPSKEPA